MKAMKHALVSFLVLASLPLLGCHKTKTYESNVEVTRTAPVRKDDQGVALTTDFEFRYVECPGTQIEVIRGGKEFSSCVAKFKVGDKVKIKIEHHWNVEGHYVADVYEVQGCPRPPDPNDEASYKMVRDCNDWNVNGTRVGFQCKYSDKKELSKKCPWFRKD